LETTKVCLKRQTFLGNDKALLETTKPCWKRQSLVGNDKALLETTRRFFVLSSLKNLNLGNVIASRGGILMQVTLRPTGNIHASTN
jgi:hypothetical protein